jgi:uncharacterized protein (DUF488 family)
MSIRMSEAIKLFTIGFTKKSAEQFFTTLRRAGVRCVIDTRLNNNSQLAGFSKMGDLRYFLRSIADMGYVHRQELAPTKVMLDAFKKEKGDWAVYEQRFLSLIEGRRIEASFPKEEADHGCLLCSEDTPEHCHRRLVAEYLARKWGNVEIIHL